MKRYIKASAMKKSKIGDEIESHTVPLIEALAQLYIFPQYEEYHNHWKREVWNQLSVIPVIKKSHKKPKATFILENSWFEHDDQISLIMSRAVSHERKLEPDPLRRYNSAEFYSICDNYFNWLSKELSKYGMVSERSVRVKLSELGL